MFDNPLSESILQVFDDHFREERHRAYDTISELKAEIKALQEMKTNYTTMERQYNAAMLYVEDFFDKSKKTMGVANADISSLLSYAFRYALGRKTYAVSDVCTLLKKYNYCLSENDKQRIIKEINESNDLGMECDAMLWHQVKDFLINKNVGEN